MKKNKFSKDQNQKSASTPQLNVTVDSNQSGIALAPSRDEVARRAYFSYLNEGSLPGRDEKHWLEAEAQLIAEMAREAQRHPGSRRS